MEKNGEKEVIMVENISVCKQNTEILPCSCAEAINQFIISTAVKNDNFHIQGSFFETKTIHLTYHGKLLESKEITEINTNQNIYMYYCFDNKWEEKTILKMNICNKPSELAYCANIYLPHKSVLYIAFTDDNGNWDTDSNSTYAFKVYPNKEKEIIERYGLNNSSNFIKKTSSELTIYNKPLNTYLNKFARKIKKFFTDTIFGEDF